jgi:orotidine-5'-phosphate decarboxylase
MKFTDQLIAAIQKKNNSVCVGLDPRFGSLPPAIRDGVDRSDVKAVALAYEMFCKAILDVVADLVPIVKPQSAFFEALGPAGVNALANIVAYAKSKNVLLLMDAKRGDIGSTAEAYAEAYLGETQTGLSSDALTVNPYMGVDTLRPFLDACQSNERGMFVLVKTSNPGSGHFQDRILDKVSGTNPLTKETLFQAVANEIELLAAATVGESGYGAVGAVVGATYPQQLAMLREQMPHAILLIPGFGAQGGGVEDVKPGFDLNGVGAIVNSSRGIIFAYNNPEFVANEWQQSVEMACKSMTEQLSVSAMKT